MAKIWLTRAELRKMIAEDAKISDDWASFFPEDEPPKKVPAKPASRVPSSNEYQPFKGKLPPMPPPEKGVQLNEPEEWDDVDVSDLDRPSQKRTPVAMKGDVRRSKYISEPPKAKQPYTKQELSAGADLEPEVKKPGMLDRVKNMFGMGKKQSGGELSQAAASPQAAAQHRANFEKYRSMYRSAEEQHDVKKSAYAKKRMQQAHKAWKDAGGQK